MKTISEMPHTLFDKLWRIHVVRQLGERWTLLHIDRHFLHDLTGPGALAEVGKRGLQVHSPRLTFATPDHVVSTQPGRTGETYAGGAPLWAQLRDGTRAAGIRLFDLGRVGQGIVHVAAPELGLVLPGTSVACADSHTCTNGAFGALAIGIGTSECAHVLATQTLRLRQPRNMRIHCEGRLAPGVTAKDLALHIIGNLGADAGTDHAIEFAGSAVTALDMEGRMTLCNLAVELGARTAVIAPDLVTINWLRGRTYAPVGEEFEQAAAYWHTLRTDPQAHFDQDKTIDAAAVVPTVTWGTSPEQAIAVTGRIPAASEGSSAQAREMTARALDYMGLRGGMPIAGTPIQHVFIGSCANARMSDLRAAAHVLRGRRVAPGVTAWVVPGSEAVKRAAEQEGLRAVFESAGFAWREPGCSLCVAANGEQIPPGHRAVSTSNRNFPGRQGPGARTHLASPATAAAAAVAGCIVDVRSLS